MDTDFPPLVSASTLHALMEAEGAKAVDASWYLPDAGRDPYAEYLEAHIPGAAFFDLEACSDRDTTLPHMLPTPERFAECMGKLGVTESDTVVAYDSAGLFSAARLWWMLRMFGHGKAAVLDGGLPAWHRAGLAVEAGKAAPRAAVYHPHYRPAALRTMEDVRHNLFSGRERVLDARSPARFYGEEKETRPGLRSGHIPGSRNVHYAGLLRKDGTLKPASELRKIFAEAGVTKETPVIASCGSGVTACILALGLEVAGFPSAAVYDGSWAEWGRTEQKAQPTPVAAGRRDVQPEGKP